MHNRQYSLLLTFSIFLENRFFQHNTASNAKDEIVKTHDAIRFSIDDVVELKKMLIICFMTFPRDLTPEKRSKSIQSRNYESLVKF